MLLATAKVPAGVREEQDAKLIKRSRKELLREICPIVFPKKMKKNAEGAGDKAKVRWGQRGGLKPWLWPLLSVAILAQAMLDPIAQM